MFNKYIKESYNITETLMSEVNTRIKILLRTLIRREGGGGGKFNIQIKYDIAPQLRRQVSTSQITYG